MAKEWVKLKYSERGKPKSNLKPLMNYGLAVTMRMELKSCSKPGTLAFLGVGCMSSSSSRALGKMGSTWGQKAFQRREGSRHI